MQNSSGQPLTLAAAYQHCLDIARNHYENFPTASKLIKADLRPAVAAIYAFARHADDLADEGDTAPDIRLKQLDAWETLLERSQQDSSMDHAIFMALADAVSRHNLPIEELHNLLIAFRMDVTVHAYASFDELRFYCKHSANPVGRLMLALHDVDDAEAIQCSDHICTALQLINFWQDISIDLPRGRCYLPAIELEKHNISGEQLLNGEIDAATLRPALEAVIEHTSSMLESGRPLLAYLPLRLRLQIAATLHGGAAMLKKIAAEPDILNQRPALSRGDWIAMALPILRDALLPGRRPREAVA